MVMQSFFLSIFVFIFVFFGSSRIALAADVTGLGDVAESLIAPVGLISNFISATAVAIGIACLFGALLRYHQFRINPVAAPISSVITLLVLGIALLCLPLLKVITGDHFDF